MSESTPSESTAAQSAAGPDLGPASPGHIAVYGPETSLTGLPSNTELYWFATGPFETNCYVFVTKPGEDAETAESEAIIVDPGLHAGIIVMQLRLALNFKVKAVYLTHGHIDHIRDAAAFDVPVYIHALDKPFLTAGLGNSPFGALFDAANYRVPTDIREFEDTIAIGDATFDVHHMPGHSPGHVMLSHEGLIVGGDVLFRNGVGRTDLPGCSPEDMVLTLKKLTTEFADDDAVLPGHGEWTTIGFEKEHNGYLKEMI